MIILENIRLDIPEDIVKDFIHKLIGGSLNLQLEKLRKE